MTDIKQLLEIMASLRDPETGCPWDKKQTFETILPYTLEETYEVAQAIEDKDMASLKAELGDLLFQVVFYAQIAKERGEFDFGDIVEAISDKLVRRHPHVFANTQIDSAEDQTQAWDEHKQRERDAKAEDEQRQASVMDDIPNALPGLMRAMKIQRRASRVGFDWAETEPVLAKIEEEIAEIREAIAEGADHDHLTHEVGDLIFASVNLARHLKVDPEVAMRGINQRFIRRFQYVEQHIQHQGISLEQAGLDKMSEAWELAKLDETKAK